MITNYYKRAKYKKYKISKTNYISYLWIYYKVVKLLFKHVGNKI